MWQKQLCLAAFRRHALRQEDQIEIFRAAGFEGFFIEWEADGAVTRCRKKAEETGMLFQSVHAPFGHARDLWEGGEAAEQGLKELTACLQDCADNGVALAILHTYIGFDKTPEITQTGLDNYGKLVSLAQRLGVKIAFENTEGEECLAALLNEFAGCDAVGFCWDSGHEMCYNRSRDLLALYGDRLLGTHLNDNLGVSRFDGKPFWTDDLHLLPFDGIADWHGVARRLNACGFDGPLTFELNLTSKPGRFDNALYARLPFEEYVALAYQRACRVASLIRNCECGIMN